MVLSKSLIILLSLLVSYFVLFRVRFASNVTLKSLKLIPIASFFLKMLGYIVLRPFKSHRAFMHILQKYPFSLKSFIVVQYWIRLIVTQKILLIASTTSPPVT